LRRLIPAISREEGKTKRSTYCSVLALVFCNIIRLLLGSGSHRCRIFHFFVLRVRKISRDASYERSGVYRGSVHVSYGCSLRPAYDAGWHRSAAAAPWFRHTAIPQLRVVQGGTGPSQRTRGSAIGFPARPVTDLTQCRSLRPDVSDGLYWFMANRGRLSRTCVLMAFESLRSGRPPSRPSAGCEACRSAHSNGLRVGKPRLAVPA
jgi:hypothetical protein